MMGYYVDAASPFRSPVSTTFAESQTYTDPTPAPRSRRASLPTPHLYTSASHYPSASLSDPAYYSTSSYTFGRHWSDMPPPPLPSLPPLPPYDAAYDERRLPPLAALDSAWSYASPSHLSPASSASSSPAAYASSFPLPPSYFPLVAPTPSPLAGPSDIYSSLGRGGDDTPGSSGMTASTSTSMLASTSSGSGSGRGAATATTFTLGPGRPKVKHACAACQRSCKKCDDFRPCGRCVRLGLPDCRDASRTIPRSL